MHLEIVRFMHIKQCCHYMFVLQLHLQSNALHTLPAQLALWKKLNVVDVQDNLWRCDCNMEWFISDLMPVLANTNPDFVLALQ